MSTRNRDLRTGLTLTVFVALLLTAPAADAILLTNGSLSVDIRADNGAIDTVTFGGTDFYNQGSPVSDWGMQNGTDTTTFRLNNTSGSEGIPVTTMTSPGEVTATGTYIAGAANVGIVRRYELVGGADALRITTLLHNNGGALTLRYFDTFDPDQGALLGFGFETTNDVLTQGSLRIGQASTTNDLTARIGGPAASATVAAGAPFAISFGSTLNNFFSTPFDGNGTVADQGMHIGYQVTLAAGASVALEYRHAYGTTAAAAAAALCGGTDDDGDGFVGYCDNCPSVANLGQEDTDGDGFGDACDTCVGSGTDDADSDGICSLTDNCPNDANPGQEDTDGNGIGDACNDAEDSDGDEWADGLDNCPADANPGQEDTCPASPQGDVCDSDADGDGAFNACDNCPDDANPGQEDTDGNGLGDACNDAEDTDGDEWADALDNCPTTLNPGQEDSDSFLVALAGGYTDTLEVGANIHTLLGNGRGPIRGTNVEFSCGTCAAATFLDAVPQIGGGYGICGYSGVIFVNLINTDERLCARSTLSGRKYDIDLRSFLGNFGCYDVDVGASCAAAGGSTSYVRNDGYGDACDTCAGPGPDDVDGDGVCGLVDNCPDDANPGQQDTDGNGLGDACNDAEDSDGDEWADALDNCPAASNPGQEDTCPASPQGDACDADTDGDGRDNPCDNCPGVANPGQQDTDGNGLGDACNQAEDSDGDEWANALDNCPAASNPGQEDTCPASPQGDACDADTDGDGRDNPCDNCPGDANPGQEDTDGNGLGDACNDAEDSDGDEWADALDSCPDDPNPGQENLNGNQYGDACEPQGRLDNAGCYSVTDTVAPPDGNEPTYSFIDISGSGTPAAVFSHSVSGAIPIGFPFEYYGVSYGNLYISSNGFLSLLSGQGEGCCGSQTLPQPAAPNAVIAALWSHIHIPSGAVYYQTLGTTPSQQFVVQFQGVSNLSAGTIDTWEIILHEGSNEIEVQYANASGSPFGGRGGIENETGTIGLQWAGPGTVTLVNQAVRYSLTAAGTDDADMDGIVSCIDNCPAIANPGQEDTCAAAPGGDACGADGDGDGVVDLCDNCPALANPGQEDSDSSGIGDACNDALDTDGDEFEDDNDNCPDDPNPGIGNVGAGAVSQLLSGLNSNNAALAALVPNRFDFFEGATGVAIGDGGNDMYDGGNFLNTNLATAISYTNGVITPADGQFGAGSSYFTAKYTGVFVMAATDLDITRFEITGNNGADGSGSVDGTVLSTNSGGLQHTIYVKRVFNAGDPSINHIVIVPGDGTGVTHSFPSNTDNDLHTIDGLSSVQSIFYILVARQSGLRLNDADVLSIANELLSSFGQADSDGDGFGDVCDPCVGLGTADGDGDTYCDLADNCPLDPNPGQEDTDGNGSGDACNDAEDSDGDEWADGLDNCPDAANPGQQDADGDSRGDACDLEDFIRYTRARASRIDASGNLINNKLPRGWRITVNDIHLSDSDPDDPENFEVMGVNGLLNPAQRNQVPAPDLNGLHYLRYQMKRGKESVAAAVNGTFVRPPKHVARLWQLENSFGSINVESKRVTGLLLPANTDLGSTPLPPADATHFVCYQVKSTDDITDQTPESPPGSGTGKLRENLQAFFEDQFHDCAFNAIGGTSFPGSAAVGKCLFDLQNVIELCNPMDKTAVESPRQTTALITPSTPTTTRSLLCYRVTLADKFTTAGTALLANRALGANVTPGQRRHTRHGVRTGNPVHTAPGNLFPSPSLIGTSRYEAVCIPTGVMSVTPVAP